jgi:hypothetical protein
LLLWYHHIREWCKEREEGDKWEENKPPHRWIICSAFGGFPRAELQVLIYILGIHSILVLN